MQAPATAAEWLRHWLYDWNGANVDLFLMVHRGLPDGWSLLPEMLGWLGSYWGAPAVLGCLLLWRSTKVAAAASLLDASLCKFVVGLAFAMSTGAVAKVVFALPRPFMVLGEAVYRSACAPDSRYTMPSGHATYIGLLLFAAAVGWSRVALGAHFPVDVVAGYLLGWACVAAAAPVARRIAPKPAPTGAA